MLATEISERVSIRFEQEAHYDWGVRPPVRERRRPAHEVLREVVVAATSKPEHRSPTALHLVHQNEHNEHNELNESNERGECTESVVMNGESHRVTREKPTASPVGGIRHLVVFGPGASTVTPPRTRIEHIDRGVCHRPRRSKHVVGRRNASLIDNGYAPAIIDNGYAPAIAQGRQAPYIWT